MLKTAGIRLNDLTKILMEKKNISFSDAFTIVQNENSELAEVYSWELQHLGNFNEKNAHDWQIYYSMVAEKLHVLAKKKESET